MNQLSWVKRAEAKRLLAAGNSLRAIASAVGCSFLTMKRYAGIYAFNVDCPCGDRAGHRGWCYWRLQFSPTRRGWLAHRWEARSDTALSALVDDAYGQARVLGHVLGTFVWSACESSSVTYAVCRVCGKRLSIYPADSLRHGRLDGTVLVDRCYTKDQLAAIKLANQEKRTWQHGKRVLRSVRAHLRASRSPTAGSTPPPTS